MSTFQTERLIIRRFMPEDWNQLQNYVIRSEVTKYDYEYPSSDQECIRLTEYFSSQNGFWAVCLKDSGNLIGHIVVNQKEPKEFLTWHIGFIFNPLYQGKGYAAEACKRILKYLFEEEKAHRVESACHPENVSACRLLEKLGMHREAHHKKSCFLRKTIDGKPIWWDNYVYAILEDEWIDLIKGQSNPS